jgi:hypothetical protein
VPINAAGGTTKRAEVAEWIVPEVGVEPTGFKDGGF